MNVRSRSALSLVIIAVLFVAFAGTDAAAQTGRISGRIIDAGTGLPLPYANVVIVGSTMGAMTLTDGTFQIVGIPVGTYTVKAMMMGYKQDELTGVSVDAGGLAEIEFRLEETIVGKTQEIVVEAEIPQIEITESDVQHRVKSDELEELPVDDVAEALALKSGIVKRGGQLV